MEAEPWKSMVPKQISKARENVVLTVPLWDCLEKQEMLIVYWDLCLCCVSVECFLPTAPWLKRTPGISRRGGSVPGCPAVEG